MNFQRVLVGGGVLAGAVLVAVVAVKVCFAATGEEPVREKPVLKDLLTPAEHQPHEPEDTEALSPPPLPDTLIILPPKPAEPPAKTGTPETEQVPLLPQKSPGKPADAEPAPAQPVGCPEGYRPSQRLFGTETFNPVKENGKIYDRWLKPEVTLVFTGRLDGYMEPCGCAGLDRMKGGLSRRATLLDALRRVGWNPVVMDTGGVSSGFSQQARMKYQATVNMFREMNYDAITLGTTDLNFPAGDILSEISTPAANGNMFISANVGVFAMDPKTLPPAKIIQRGGVKIGIVGVLGEGEQKAVRNDEIVFRNSVESLKKIVPQLREKCDFVILLAHASDAESRQYAKAFPDVDIIATSAGPPVPPATMEVIPETGQYYITVGERGTHLVTLGIYRDEENPVRYQRVALDSRFQASKKFVNLMALYQDELEHAGLKGLGIRPLPNPFAETHGDYVGSARCESCHEDVFLQWQKTRHAKAWRPLAEAKPARTSDPECVVCHVVGWNVEHKTPYTSGFLSPKETRHLMNVGCEVCHGPGAKHITAEMGTDAGVQDHYRKAVRQNVEEAKKSLCVTCHDLDNSPNFDFDLYWKCIEHKEDWGEEE